MSTAVTTEWMVGCRQGSKPGGNDLGHSKKGLSYDYFSN